MLEKSVFYDVFTNGVDCFEENGDSFGEVCVCESVCKLQINYYSLSKAGIFFFEKLWFVDSVLEHEK